MKVKLEYIWLDGYKPEPNLRSKIKVVDYQPSDITKVPEWGFDGSSTMQAEGFSSDCYLKPVRMYQSLEITSTPLIYVLLGRCLRVSAGCLHWPPSFTPNSTWIF